MLKQFWAWLTSLFAKELSLIELEAKEAEAKKRIAKTAESLKKHVRSRMTASELRYEWLCSTGYTPYVHLGTDPKPEKPLSNYRLMVNHCSNLGEKLRKEGKKIVRVSSRKNKWGIDLEAYRL